MSGGPPGGERRAAGWHLGDVTESQAGGPLDVTEMVLTPWPPNRQDAALMPRLRRASTGVDQRAEDAEVVERLRQGDEAAFAELIDRYGATMLRVAQMYVKDRASAE